MWRPTLLSHKIPQLSELYYIAVSTNTLISSESDVFMNGHTGFVTLMILIGIRE